MRSRRRGGRIPPEALAGWVFADILIVLFFVGLGSAVPPDVRRPTPKPKPVPKRIVGMRTHPRIAYVGYDPGALLGGAEQARRAGRSVCRQVRRATKPVRRQRAALVLIFGGGRDVNGAVNSARAVSRQLACANKTLFKKTVVRPFWTEDLPSGKARLEVFLFTTS